MSFPLLFWDSSVDRVTNTVKDLRWARLLVRLNCVDPTVTISVGVGSRQVEVSVWVDRRDRLKGVGVASYQGRENVGGRVDRLGGKNREGDV